MPVPATQQHLNQVRENITNDTRLTAGEKASAIEVAELQYNVLQHDDSAADVWADHCDKGILALANQAELCPLGAAGRLGNIWAITSFQNSVARQLRCSANEAKRLVELACKLEADLTEDERDELSDAFETIALREGADCWLFEGIGDQDQPFQGLDTGALSCRLGLPYRTGELFAAFSIIPPPDTRRPCALNADWFFHRFWRPGGSTRPFCSTSLEPGFQEWIATPPRLADIGGPAIVAEVEDGNPVGIMPYDVA
jgi:hypothetical protein